jgi:hypothetical protein
MGNENSVGRILSLKAAEFTACGRFTIKFRMPFNYAVEFRTLRIIWTRLVVPTEHENVEYKYTESQSTNCYDSSQMVLRRDN